MTTATLTSGGTAAKAAPPSLVTRPLLLRFVSVVGASLSFYLPLSVMPMYAKSSGTDTGAGLVTGALLVTTVAVELATPRLLAGPATACRWARPVPPRGARAGLARGVGSGRGHRGERRPRSGLRVTTVAGGALTASLIPAERRGEGLGLAGIVSGVPALVALPAGVWVANSLHWGFRPVFAATAAAALLALVVVPGMPGHRGSAGGAHGVLSMVGDLALLRPCRWCSAHRRWPPGALVTFLPLAIAGRSATVATAALFVQPPASTVARWAACKTGDRRGHAGLLRPGVVLSAAGVAALAVTSSPGLVIGGAAVFGTGFGLLQNATLTLMYARVPATGQDAVSAIWNAAYDAGMGAGAPGMAACSPGTPATRPCSC